MLSGTGRRARTPGAGVSDLTPDFSDGFETGDLTHTENSFAWQGPDGTDAISGTGANGSFTRTSGSWTVNGMVGKAVYLQSVAGNASGDDGLLSPFTVTSNTSTVLSFVGDASTAVQMRTHRAFITSQFARTGSYSIRCPFGPDEDLGDSRSQPGFDFPLAGVGEFWTERYFHIPSNYTHRSPGDGITNNKFFGIWGRNQTSDASNMLWDFEVESNGSGGSDLFAQSYLTSGNFSSGAIHIVGDLGFTGAGIINAPGAPAVLGAWNQVRTHCKPESALNAADGLMELWIEGTKCFKASGRRFGYPAAPGSLWYGTYPALVDNGYFLGAANSGYADQTVFHIDDVKFYLADPSW